MGTELLVRLLADGLPEPTAQVGEATYAAKIDPGEHHLDWGQAAEHLHRVVRLGGAWTKFRGRRLLVPRATLAGGGVAAGWLPARSTRRPSRSAPAGEGRWTLVEVQPEGKPVQAATSWRHGARLAAGDHLGP